MADEVRIVTFREPLTLATGERPLRICHSVCEPICARSDYEIGITVFGNDVATIAVRGLTRLYNCREDREQDFTAAAPQ